MEFDDGFKITSFTLGIWRLKHSSKQNVVNDRKRLHGCIAIMILLAILFFVNKVPETIWRPLSAIWGVIVFTYCLYNFIIMLDKPTGHTQVIDASTQTKILPTIPESSFFKSKKKSKSFLFTGKIHTRYFRKQMRVRPLTEE